MSKSIHLKKEEQQIMPLFNGAFIENKPIPFPDRSGSKGYSNLFYWANLDASRTDEFPLHPHEGFEILTFVFKGSLVHSDSLNNQYTTLNEGGVQVIQSGSGVQHAERIIKGSQMFQIWFDPDFSKTLKNHARYKDYHANEFSSKVINGIERITYGGEGGPIHFETQGIQVEKLTFSQGEYSEKIDKNSTYSYYLLNGEIKINDELVLKDSFLVLNDDGNVNFNVEKEAELFIIKSPSKVNYRRFIDRY